MSHWLRAFSPGDKLSEARALVISLVISATRCWRTAKEWRSMCSLGLLGGKRQKWIFANLNGNRNWLGGYQVIKTLAVRLEDQVHGWMETRDYGVIWEGRMGRSQPGDSTPTPTPPLLHTITELNAVAQSGWLERAEHFDGQSFWRLLLSRKMLTPPPKKAIWDAISKRKEYGFWVAPNSECPRQTE